MPERQPPISLYKWLKQVKEDPCIPAKFKNGNEDQLKLSDTTFRSGSMLNSTEYLHLRVIWHPYTFIDSLGDLMKNDPNNGWTGFISEENIRKADILFHEKRPLWRQYLNELRLRLIEEESNTQTVAQPFQSSNGSIPRQPLRPSIDCGVLRPVIYCQTLVILNTSERVPATGELERAYSIPTERAKRLAVNQTIPPKTPKGANPQAQDISIEANQNTPVLDSYQPASGGKHNKPSADEFHVNSALLTLLQNITMMIGGEFDSLDWAGARLPFKLTESVTITDSETGHPHTDIRPIMEARVDGYLCLRDSPFDEGFNETALAIMEVKPFTFASALTPIRRQEGAEMACWISQAGDSTTGLLQSSASGRKRRLMLSQHRHEIFIVVGEYGAGFEGHIRPSRSVVRGPGKGSKASKQPTATSTTGNVTQEDNSIGTSTVTPPRRPPGVLAGSPSYIRRVEQMSIEVAKEAGPLRKDPQPTQNAPETRKLRRGEKRWVPDVGDFLIMHEFGPFITTRPDHMEVFIKRYIALMLELRGTQDPFVDEAVSTRFLFSPDFIHAPSPNEASSTTTRLRKARSWTATTRKANEDWEKPSEKPEWSG